MNAILLQAKMNLPGIMRVYGTMKSLAISGRAGELSRGNSIMPQNNAFLSRFSSILSHVYLLNYWSIRGLSVGNGGTPPPPLWEGTPLSVM